MSLKKVLVAVLGTLALLILAALVIPSFLDWNHYRAQIEDMAEAATGRDVRIEGDVSFGLLPAPSFTAKLVSVANFAEGTAEHMAELEALDVRVALLPLLSGVIQVEKIVLVRPVIHLERLADGRVNWDFMEDEERGVARQEVRLDRFVVEDGEVSYRDAVEGRFDTAQAIDVLVTAESLRGPIKITGSLLYRDVPLALDFSMGRRSQQELAPVTADFHLAQAKLAVSGIVSFGERPGFEGSLKINAPDAGQALSSIVRIVGDAHPPVYMLPQPFEAAVRLKAARDEFATSAFNFALGDSKGTGEVAARLRDKPELRLAFAFSTLDADVLIAAMPKAPADAPAAPKAPANPDDDGLDLAQVLALLDPRDMVGEVQLTADAIRHRGRIIRQAEMSATAAEGKLTIRKFHALLPGGSDLDLVGHLTGGETPRFDGRIAASSNNLRGLLDWLEIDVRNVPPARLTAFAVASGVTLEPARVVLDDSMFRLDTMTAKGGAVYDLGPNPRLAVTADLDRLDISDYLAPGRTCLGPEAGGPLPPTTRPGDGKAAPADATFGALTVSFRFSVDRLSCRPLEGEKVALDLTIEGGRLEIASLEAQQLLGLAVEAGGGIEDFAGKPRFDLALSAKGPSLLAVERAFPDILPAPARRLGSVDIKVGVKGRASDLRFSTSGRVGQTNVQAEGRVTREGETVKAMDLNFSGRNSSLAALIDQWDLGLTPPAQPDDRAVAVEGAVKGGAAGYELDVRADLAGAKVIGRGNLKRRGTLPEAPFDYALVISAEGNDARGFLRGLGVAFGEQVKDFGPINMTAEVSGSAERLVVQRLGGTFGPLALNGAGEARLTPGKPRISGELKTGPILVDRFMGERSKAKKAKEEWSDDPYDLAWLEAFDAEVRIEAESLMARDYLFEAPRMTLLVQDGRLAVRGLTGKLFGGDVTLDFAFGGARDEVPAMTLAFDIRDASMEQALKTAAGLEAVTGTLNLKGNFRGAGASPAALIRSVAGDADLTLSEGLVRGIDLPRLSHDMGELRDAKGLGKLLTSALAGGETRHKGFATVIQGKDGALSLSDLVVNLDGGKALFTARVDLPTWTTKSGGRLQLASAPNAPPIGFDIAGALNEPKVSFNSKEFQTHMVAEIGRALIERASGASANPTSGGTPMQRPEPPPKVEERDQAPEGVTPEQRGRVLFDRLLDRLKERETERR